MLHCCLLNGGSPDVLYEVLYIVSSVKATSQLQPAVLQLQRQLPALLPQLQQEDAEHLTALDVALSTRSWAAAGALMRAGALDVGAGTRCGYGIQRV